MTFAETHSSRRSRTSAGFGSIGACESSVRTWSQRNPWGGEDKGEAAVAPGLEIPGDPNSRRPAQFPGCGKSAAVGLPNLGWSRACWGACPRSEAGRAGVHPGKCRNVSGSRGLAPFLFSLLHVLREYGTSWDPPAALGPRTSSSVPPVARTDHRAGPDHAHGRRQDRLGGILHEYRFDRHVRARVLTYLQRELAAGWRRSG